MDETRPLLDIVLKPQVFADRMTTRKQWDKIDHWRREVRRYMNKKTHEYRPAMMKTIQDLAIYGQATFKLI